MRTALLLLLLGCAGTPPVQEEGFVPLFNGKDLTGWVRVNCAPETFRAEGGEIITTGKPTGVMRTDRMYENYIIELDWMHLKPRGNSGLFVHSGAFPAKGTPFTKGHEIQVLDGDSADGTWTGHGDVFSIHGATFEPDRPHPKGWMRCLPSEKRANPAGQWNHYRVTVNDGTIKLEVNGKEVSGGKKCNPRKGYICLESEGSECHFKNLKIAELPSTNPAPDEIAAEYQGFKTIYTGLDLAGWRQVPGQEGHWQPTDWILHYDGKCEATDPRDKHLWTEKEYGDFELIVDWRFPAKSTKKKYPVVLPTGDDQTDAKGEIVMREVDDAGNSGIFLRGSEDAQINMCCYPVGSGEITAFRTNKQLSAAVRAAVTPTEVADAPLGKWNHFLITLKGDRVTVLLNNKPILTDAQLPGIPARGPIGLQHHNEIVEFANLFIREL